MKRKKRGLRRIAAFTMAAVLAVTSVEIPAAALDGNTGAGDAGKGMAAVTAFSQLEDAIQTQTLDTGATEDEINFPDSLKVTLELSPEETGGEGTAETEGQTEGTTETQETTSDTQTGEDAGTQETPGETESASGTEETEQTEGAGTEGAETQQTESAGTEETGTQQTDSTGTEETGTQQTESAGTEETGAQQTEPAGTEEAVTQQMEAPETEAAVQQQAETAEQPAATEAPAAETAAAEKAAGLTSLLDAVFPTVTAHAADVQNADGKAVEDITLTDLTWKIDAEKSSSETFQSETAAEYVYVPELPKTVTIDGIEYALVLKEGVELPEIMVTIAKKTDGYGTIIQEGTTGNCTWTLYDTDGDGTEDLLVIGGTGAMPDYYFIEDAPWYYYRENIKKVVVEEGITALGKSAFNSCLNLEEAALPSTLGKIGTNAFYSCTSLDTLAIPSGVTEIGAYAFSNCSRLESVILPSLLESIGQYAFVKCGLVQIEIPGGVETIGQGAFCRCASLQSVVLPDTLTSIEKEAFYNDFNLTIIVPESVQTIETWAFDYVKAVYNLSDCAIPGQGSSTEVNCDKITLVENGKSSEQRVLPADCVAGSRYENTRYDASYYYSPGEENTAWYVENGGTYEKVTSGTSFQNTPTFYYAKALNDTTVEAEAAGESGDSYTLVVKDKETGEILAEGTHYTQEATGSPDWVETDTGSLAKTVTVTITGIAGGGYVGTMQTAFQIHAEAEASVTADGTTKKYPAFEDAWRAAQGKTAVITLLADAEVSEVLTVTEGSNITLQSDPGHAEHTLLGNANEKDGGLINITGGTFTLVSGTVRNGESGSNAIAVSGGGSFVMNGGTAEALADGHSGICVYKGGTATINGGSARGYNGLAIVDNGSGTIYGGTFTGTFNVSDGSAAVLLRNVGSTTLKDILEPNSGRAYYSGTEVTAKNLITKLDGKSLTGTVTVGKCEHSYSTWADDGDGKTHSAACVVCGHEKTEAHDWDTDGSCKAEGCTAQAAASVKPEGGEAAYYPTIEEAWKAAKEQSSTDVAATVRLLKDTAISSDLTVEEGDNIILVSGGNANYSISSGSDCYAVISVTGGKLTLGSGTVNGQGDGYATHGIYMEGGSFTMTGGTISGKRALYVCRGTAVISDGTLNGDSSFVGYGLVSDYGDVTLRGGTYSGGSDAIMAAAGKVNSFLAEGYAYKQNGTWINDDNASWLPGVVTVEKAPIAGVSVTVDKTSLVYGDAAPTLTATVIQPEGSTKDVIYQWYRDGEKIAGATGETYTPNRLDAGEYVYTCTATVDGYSLPGTAATVTVNRADIENAVVTLSGTSFEYYGDTLDIWVQLVKLNDTELNYGTDYTYSGYTGKDADTYTVKVEGKGNYTGTATATWEIYPKELNVKYWTIEKVYDGTADIVLDGTEFQLDGYAWHGQNDDVKLDASGVTAKFSDASAGEGKDITYTGEFTLTGKDAGNYILKEMPASLTGTITQRKITVTPDRLTKEYGAEDPTLTYQITSGSLVEGHTLTLERAAGDTIGSYAVDRYTITDADGNDVTGNYDVTLEAVDFQITRPDLATATVTLALPDDGYTYDGAGKAPDVTVVKNGEMVAPGEYDVTYSDNVNAGTVTVTVTARDGGNYYGSNSTATFTITPADLSGAVVEPASELMYSGEEQEQKVTVTVGGVELTEGTDYTLSENTGTDAGDYTLTVSGTGNYTGNAKGTFMIARAKVMVYFVNATDRTYEQGNTAVEVKVTFNGYEPLTGIEHSVTARMEDDSAGDRKPVTVTVEVTDPNYQLYTMDAEPIDSWTGTTTVKIEKATPDLGTVGYTGTICPDTPLADIVLTRTDETVPGTLALNEGQTLSAGSGAYDWTFVPQDTVNYNEFAPLLEVQNNSSPYRNAQKRQSHKKL